MAFVGKEDKARIEQEMAWEDRDLPVTFHQLLSRTAEKFPNHNAVSFQLFSGPNDKAETLTWSNLLGQVNQAANLFRSLGIGENDVETRAAILGQLSWIGLELDDAANAAGQMQLTAEGSAVSAWIIPAAEEAEIARDAFDLLRT